MRLPSADFESAVSANFTTRPYQDCTAERGAGTSSERGLYRAAGERGPESSRKRVQGETERVSPCRAMSAQNGGAAASQPHRYALFSLEYTCPLWPLRSLQAQVLLQAATSTSSAASVVAVSSSAMGDSNAARMTLAVCWITSKLSASNDALPW